MNDARRDEIRSGLEAVRTRIALACAEAGRSADSVTLIVVTKFFPASDVRLLAELGVTDVGENRHPEAAEKRAACTDLRLTWHFVGGLQSNKAAAIAQYVDAVHSVDRAKLLDPLGKGAHLGGRPLDCLVQVSLEDPAEDLDAAGRSGVAPADVGDLAHAVAAADGLRLRGVMAVAPLGADPGPAFARLAEIAAEVRLVDPGATWVSAGMSDDLEAAVKWGATHVRIGRAVLGERPLAG